MDNSLQELESLLADESHGQTQFFSQTILKALTTRVEFLHGTLNQSQHDYNLYPVHAHTKRGLIYGLGQVFQYLFGTALDEDVQDLREHYNPLINIAATNNRVLNLHHNQPTKLESNLNELLQYSNDLATVLNHALLCLDVINHVVVIDQVLHVFKASLDSVLSINEAIIRNLVDAANGRVTTSLFPVEDLLHTLETGQSTYKLTPLYSQDMIQHYYPLLESTLTTDAMIINIPFKSLDHFDAYEVTTFPFSVHNSVMTLDMNPS